jgi:serine protease Do
MTNDGRVLRVCLVAAAAMLVACAQPALPRAAAAAAPPQPSFATALARALPFTVGVYAVGGGDGADVPRPIARDDDSLRRGDEVDRMPGGMIGAGIVLRADGLIATAAHVVAGARRVVVQLPDERVLQAVTLGVDEDTDIALLKVAERWTAGPPLGHSIGLRPGDWVLAVGEPFGLQRTVTAGIVGGPVRHFLEDREVVFLQTDLTLNPGHSGGPLLDAQGAIVGMNARAIAGAYGMAGMSLTVPIELVMQIAEELQGGGRAERPRFDARFEDLLPPQAIAAGMTRASGAVVRSVRRDGVAARLGLRAGDIVVGFGGQPVGDSAELARLLLERRDALRLRAIVFRSGGYVELRLP